MNSLIQRKTTILSFMIVLGLGCFSLSPKARATDLDSVLPNYNTADGSGVLISLTTGAQNTGIGFEALNHDTSGNFNTAEGSRALYKNTNGSGNTAAGANALLSNTAGAQNTATGVNALRLNTVGGNNTADGAGALNSNATGSFNTAVGHSALQSNTTGHDNTATGFQALSSNIGGVNGPGSFNTAIGSQVLKSNTTGTQNTATGNAALIHNDIGGFNTAIGVFALGRNTSGNENIAIGIDAGEFNTTGSDNIDIGNGGGAADDQTIRIGIKGIQKQTFIAGISGVTTQHNDAIPVLIDSIGQLGTVSSSRRFKKEIQPMDKASEAILALKPVTFHYKSDKTDRPEFGLIAEEVAEVSPDLVVRDENGDIYTVRYDAVNAMLLNEFLKEHRKVEEQETTISQLKSTVAQQQKGMEALAAQLKEQAAEIRKVSTQRETSKRQVAGNQ